MSFSPEGCKANMVQIGLGNNRTFIYNFEEGSLRWSGHMEWLLASCSTRDPTDFVGVAVEPVSEHAREAQKVASECLPRVRVLQAAIGQSENGKGELHVLKVPSEVKGGESDGLKVELEYLRNMSCLGRVHPDFQQCKDRIEWEHDVSVWMDPREVDVVSWESLVKITRFKGTEVLLIDAEGSDASILRSMLEYCLNRPPEEMPDLIQFESRGHCDRLEHGEVETDVIDRLVKAGYMLVCRSHQDTYMVKNSAVGTRRELSSWMQTWKCSGRGKDGSYPYELTAAGVMCRKCAKRVQHAWE